MLEGNVGVFVGFQLELFQLLLKEVEAFGFVPLVLRDEGFPFWPVLILRLLAVAPQEIG